MNVITLLGRFTSAAIPRGTNDQLGAAFTLAVPRSYKNAYGEYDADFIDCIAFGKRAEFILGHFQKGSRAAVTGTLKVSTYTTDSGEKRRSWSVVVENIDFADAPAAAAPVAAAPVAAAPAAAAPPSPWDYPGF